MNYKDYYKIMGLESSASQDDIKKSYRKLARKYHPDVSKEKDAETRFKDVSEAYEVLRDKEKRAAYDQLGSNWQGGQAGFNPPPNWQEKYQRTNGGFSGGAQGEYSDFFESLFGGGFGASQRSNRNHRSVKGQDSHSKILIDLQDAYTGSARNFSLQEQVYNENGQLQTKVRTLKVNIPKGIKSGQKVRLKEQGQAGSNGAKNGDLYIEIGFNPNPMYSVDGADISVDLSISPWQAALGDKVKVPTPNGNIDLNVPKLISSGSKMRLKGRGLPSKVPGDFFVKLKIVYPKELSAEEKKLYEALRELDIKQRGTNEQTTGAAN